MVADMVQSETFAMRVLLVMMMMAMAMMMTMMMMMIAMAMAMMIVMAIVMITVMTMAMTMAIAMMGFLDRWLSGGWDRVIAAYKQLARQLPHTTDEDEALGRMIIQISGAR